MYRDQGGGVSGGDVGCIGGTREGSGVSGGDRGCLGGSEGVWAMGLELCGVGVSEYWGVWTPRWVPGAGDSFWGALQGSGGVQVSCWRGEVWGRLDQTPNSAFILGPCSPTKATAMTCAWPDPEVSVWGPSPPRLTRSGCLLSPAASGDILGLLSSLRPRTRGRGPVLSEENREEPRCREALTRLCRLLPLRFPRVQNLGPCGFLQP